MEEKSDISLRIEKIMSSEQLNPTTFANLTNIQTSTLSHLINGRNKPSLEVIQKILSRFKNINPDWLILGAEPMYRQISKSEEPTLFDNIGVNNYQSTGSNRNIGNIFNQENFQSREVPVVNTPIRPVEEKVERSLPIVEQQVDRTTAEVLKSAISEIKMEQNYLDVTAIKPESQIKSVVEKKIDKIILYFSDNSFQEFDPANK
jgi:predicted transcriptional regulator